MAESAVSASMRAKAMLMPSGTSGSPSSKSAPISPSAAPMTRTPAHSGSPIGSLLSFGDVRPNRCGRIDVARSAAEADSGADAESGGMGIEGHRSRDAAAYHRAVATAVASDGPATALGGLARLTPSGRTAVPVAWSLYDFANTIFSYAIVSTAIGLWLTDDSRFGQGLGQLVLGLAIAISVGINALVSPLLGALSDRGGRRLPFLLFFTILTIAPTILIGPSPALVGAALF